LIEFRRIAGSSTPNIVETTIGGGINTTSGTPVSTGAGVTLTKQNNGIVTALGFVQCFAELGVTRLNYQVYFSTVGIPAEGAAPNAGDIEISPTASAVDPYGDGVNSTLPLTGYISGVTGTFYVYVVFWSGGGVYPNYSAGGQLIVRED
jgi:hypothetical protein